MILPTTRSSISIEFNPWSYGWGAVQRHQFVEHGVEWKTLRLSLWRVTIVFALEVA